MNRICQLSYVIFMSLHFMSNAQTEPKAPKKDHQLTKHGHVRNDVYYWMSLRNSPAVLDYISAENNYSALYFKALEPLKEKLLKEFEQRIDPNDQSAPFFMDGMEFQSKNIAGKDYVETYYRKSDKDKWTLFFDENKQAAGKSYYDLGDWSLSQNKSILAFSEDHIGRRKYSIFFREEKKGKILKDEIKNTDGSIVWANDNQTVFYVRKDPQTLREFQVFRHKLGTDSKTDALVFEEKDEKFAVSIEKSQSDKYIVIVSQSSTTNESLLINANHPELPYQVFIPRKQGHLYAVADHNAGFYVTSNEKAPNNKLLYYAAWPEAGSKPEEIVKHSFKRLIEGALVLKRFVVMQVRENGLPSIEIMDIASGKTEQIKMNEETYNLNLGFNDDYDPSSLYYDYTSMTTPPTVYRYDFDKKSSTAFFQKKLIDPKFKPENYESKRIWATANDGTQIPVSIVYKKGIDLSKAPLLLYGYGSYGSTIPAHFSATRLSLLDRGFVYALAHIRGGKDLGETWYENGKFLKKVNTFTDFINAAEYLGMKSYCDPAKIYAMGGSAGGLLMGAVTNMAPYLWKGVVAQVPFVDVVTTMLDETIPLTVGEYEEWGNPNQEEYYYYMLNYSPYDNVKRMDYPAMYVTTGYHDSQVQYWEPLKWIAKLRDFRTNANPLLLDCNMDAGHGGGSGRTNERIEVAKEFSFILGLEGITE